MKRLRFFCILGAIVMLVGVTTLVGGAHLRSGNAHAAASGMAPGQVPLDTLTHYHLGSGNLPAQQHVNGHLTHGLTNIDAIPNFSGKYHADGFDPSGNPNKQWVYNTVGAPPEHGGTTTIRAPIIPVSLDLLAPNGSVLVHVDATHDVPPTLNSPLFQNASYSSSNTPTQFNDAIQRAEFASSAKSDWHTLLQPVVEPGVTLEMPWGSFGYAVWVSGPQAGQIAFVLLDGVTVDHLMLPTTTFSWPPDTSTVLGRLEAAGDITTRDIATFLFPDTFQLDEARNVFAGFHSWDIEPGDASNGNLQRYFTYIEASWFSAEWRVGPVTGITDISPLSHELSETFNDPFVGTDADLNNVLNATTGAHDITPWWFSGGICLDYLETGDVTERLPTPDDPISMNGMTYHPQNEALLQWFEGVTPSDAIGGAYSYPDTTVLTTANPPNIPLNCGQ
jgi:hypothetical protein